MKTLTITQPFASLILAGEKRIETRSWQTKYRGSVQIHVAKGLPTWARILLDLEPFRAALAKHRIKDVTQLPFGVLLGVVDLVDCLPAEEVVPWLDDRERSLGDFRMGNYAWIFERPRLLPSPITYRGRLGLFEVADAVNSGEWNVFVPFPNATLQQTFVGGTDIPVCAHQKDTDRNVCATQIFSASCGEVQW